MSFQELSFAEYFKNSLIQEKLNHTHGSYMSVGLDKKSANNLFRLVKKAGIMPVDAEKMHCTLIYSRVGIPKAREYKVNLPVLAKVKEWKLFDTQEGNKCLVAVLDSKELEKIHTDVMKKYGGTYDYPSYIPHVTVCYNYKGDKAPDLGNPTLTFNKSTFTPLDTDWKA